MSDTITELQGNKIIRLLESIVEKLDEIKGDTTWLSGIDDNLKEISREIGSISRDVSSIEAKD